MSANTSKTRKKARLGASSGPAGRSERRFVTSSAYIALWVALVGMAGALLLGAGAFGMWILDPPIAWASYLVAGGGVALGVALWFGGPAETAVLVGDGGIAVEDGRDVARMPWYQLEAVTKKGDSLVLSGAKATVRFSLGANPKAAAYALAQVAERRPSALQVHPSAVPGLPAPDANAGSEQTISDDQVAGSKCAASEKPIQVEDEARHCPRCGQIYHKDTTPERCVSCDAELAGRTLRA
jgi:hypothetical protein